MLVVVLLTACGDNIAGDESSGRRHHGRRSHRDGVHASRARTSSADDLAQPPGRHAARSTSSGSCRSSARCSTTTRASAVTAATGAASRRSGPTAVAARRRRSCAAACTGGTPDVPGGPACRFPASARSSRITRPIGLPEVVVTLTWLEHVEMLGDGTRSTLRAPITDIRTPNGESDAATARCSRIARHPAVFGLGLLEAVDDADDPRAGRSRRRRRRRDLGSRRTWCGTPRRNATERRPVRSQGATPRTCAMQTAGAFANDMGLSNKVFPDPTATSATSPTTSYEQTVFFVSTLAVPAAGARGRERDDRPRSLFDDVRLRELSRADARHRRSARSRSSRTRRSIRTPICCSTTWATA